MDISHLRKGCARVGKLIAALPKQQLSVALAIVIALTGLSSFSPVPSSYTIIDNGKTATSVQSTKTAAEQIIAANGIQLTEHDVVTKSENVIEIARRIAVTVSYHGIAKQFIVRADSVNDILATLGVELTKKDVVTPSIDKALTESTEITVNKVEYETKKNTKTLSYSEYKKLAAKNGDKVTIKDADKVTATTTVKNKLVNGKVESTQIIETVYKAVAAKKSASVSSSSTSTKAVTTSNSVKTISPLKPSKPIELDKNGAPISYKKVFKGRGTAYTGDNWTASGRRAGVGYIAVDPDQIPYGSKLYIRTPDNSIIYGYAVAADTGGFVSWGTVLADLYLESEAACISFGVRNIEIYVL